MKKFPRISRRGVRIVGCVLLFGTFAFGYGRLMIGEQLSALFAPYGIVAPFWWGLLAVVISLPFILYVLYHFANRLSDLSLLSGLAMLCFGIGLITPTNELHLLELRTARLAAQQQYDEALAVGQHSHLTSHLLTALRSEILLLQGEDALPRYFFDYPLPLAANSHLLAPPRHPYLSQLRTPSFKPHAQLISLLLDRKLTAFAEVLARQDWKKEELPPIYLQAILLHKRLTPFPILTITDATTEANYRDFIEHRTKIRQNRLLHQHPSLRAEGNLMRSLYGNTYWWYYYYNRPLNS